MRLPVGESLAFCALDSPFRTGFIVHAKAGAIVLAKIKFREIARHVLFANMLIRADKAALEDAEIAFCGVRVDRSSFAFASILLVVVNAFVLRHKAR